MGISPYAAPNTVVAAAIDTGIPNATVATRSAEASPSSAAMCACNRKNARDPSNTNTGNAATIVDNTTFRIGS